MTVKELTVLLSDAPKDSEVFIFGGGLSITNPAPISEGIIYKSFRNISEGYTFSADYDTSVMLRASEVNSNEQT